MSADVLDRPASLRTPRKNPAPPEAASPTLFHPDRLQAIVDAVCAPVIDGVRRPLPLPSVIPGITPMSDETDKEGRQLQMPCCTLGENGEVEPFSGPVVTDDLCKWFEDRIRPRLEQMAWRQLSVMARSLDPNGRGVVEKRAKVIMPIPGVDDF